MMVNSTRHSIQSQDGFDVHVLQSDSVEVRIVPELGAKIIGLGNLITGREWMWSRSGSRLFANRMDDPFHASPLIGADECFPTIAPCTWNGRELGDHGEVWNQKWKVSASHDSIDTSLSCPVSPFDIRRVARLHGNELTLDYTLTSRSSQDEAFLWAFHPLIRFLPDDWIDLPTETVVTDLSIACPLGKRGDQWAWPVPQPGIRLDRMDFGACRDAAAKMYSVGLREGRVAIRNDSTGDALEFCFDLKGVNTVGIWINQGGWSGYRHVAIEPCNGAPDPLDVAYSWNRCGHLSAQAAAQWSLHLKLPRHPTS